jgi:hypothetical protein
MSKVNIVDVIFFCSAAPVPANAGIRPAPPLDLFNGVLFKVIITTTFSFLLLFSLLLSVSM